MKALLIALLLLAGCASAPTVTVTETKTATVTAAEPRVACQDLIRGLTDIIQKLSARYIGSETKANAGISISGEGTAAVQEATEALDPLKPLVSTCVNG